MAVARRKEAEAAGTRIGGRYIVEATLGRGGMGAVFRVHDDANGRALALKQIALAAGVGEDDRNSAQLRFRREFHTMASLKHPCIVEVFDYGIEGRTPYYTMELLDGQDLHDLDKIAAPRACSLLRDVASALAFLHARRLLHRDLAPRNVRCTSTGHAKLIDFGVLATTGVVGDVAGTPPMMAPEGLHGRPLDPRYDLYGLGALAYRILTGRHAYPARTLEALEATWRVKPPAPSSLAPDIPPALDELVIALLAQDPLARPASAAEVIDRLTAIAGLERPAEVETSRGWIASAALVGRQREVQQIRRAATRAHAGEGRSLLIEAPSGTGKTRLLREVGLEAQLAGTTVVRADSEAASRGPYGIVHELARGVFAAAPDAAGEAAATRAPILARVIASLRDRVKPAKPLGDPAEDRIQLQNELCAFFLEVAAAHPIALLVDDIQRCDEASAAVIATLAHRAAGKRLLLAAALRTDESVRAPAPIAALVDAGQRLRLRGLDETDVAELCRSLFGDVQHVPRLAQWMHRTAGGSPLHTTELARHLVDRGVIRYVDGLWSIPEEPEREDLPQGLVDAMDARVRSLPAGARGLGEALSIHGGELTLELAVLVADNRDEGEVFAALDQLGYEEVIVHSGETWRFRHDGLREALLRGLSDERRRALHLRVGEALAAREPRSVELDAEIGWHLLRGGERVRGGALLEKAGRALYEAQSFSDAIAPLEAALEVYDERRHSRRIRCEILHMLVMSGALTNRKIAMRHADACIDEFRYWAGVDVMAKMRRFIGKHLAVAVGLWWALLRWIFSPRRGPNPYEAFRTHFIIVGYTASVYSMTFDIPNVDRMVRAVEPIAIFKNRVPYAVYLMTRNLLEYPRGNVGAVRRNSVRLLEILETDRITPIRDIDRRTGGGGARYLLALAAVSNVEPTWTRELEELAKLKMRFYDIGAENVRVIYHRMRGEEDTAAEIEAKVELLFVQLGSVWQMEAFMPVVASLAYAFTRDTIGLRRAIDRLSRQVDDGFKYTPYLRLARGEYLRERGDLEEARVELEAAMQDEHLALVRVPAFPALAETMLALGQHDRACELAREGIALGTDPDRGNINGKLRSVRALALAEAARGEFEAAASRLDEAIVEAHPRGSPLLSGTLHEARARVALLANDWLGYHQHLAETEHQYRSTRNPVLVAHAERLAQAGQRQAAREAKPSADVDTAVVKHRDVALVAEDAVTTPPPAAVHSWVSAVLSSCRGSSERAQRVLDLVVGEARGASGYLYLRTHEGFALVAPSWGDEPPAGLARGIRRALDAAADASEPPTAIDVRRDDEIIDWKPIVLALTVGATRIVIGVVAVIGGAMRLVEPPAPLLEEIARGLFDAGDVTYTRTLG
jgi:tetratricopeptide (TPR) repeat protein